MASKSFQSDSEAFETMVNNMLANARCCIPGIVESFDSGNQTVQVTPAIMRKKYSENGSIDYVKLPIILNVPIVVPCVQMAGLFVTLPIQSGDEGMIYFADRFIDNFVERGGFQPPEAAGADNKNTEPRAHSLTDAMFFPGIISKPNAIPNWNTNALELRTKEGKDFIRLNAGSNGIQLTTGGGYGEGGSDIIIKGGKISIKAASSIDILSPNMVVNSADGTASITGTMRANELETNAGFKANTHVHSGVEPGGSNTGVFA